LDVARVIAADDGSEMAVITVDLGVDVNLEGLAANIAELLDDPEHGQRKLWHAADLSDIAIVGKA